MKTSRQRTRDHHSGLRQAEAQSPGLTAEQHPIKKTRFVGASSSGDSAFMPSNTEAGFSQLNATTEHRREMGDEMIAPRTTSEKIMASIWAEILNLKQVSVHDNFFDHGHDSYSAMEFVAKVRKVFAVNLSVRALFEKPTIAGMTAAVLKTQRRHLSSFASDEQKSEIYVGRKRSERARPKTKF